MLAIVYQGKAPDWLSVDGVLFLSIVCVIRLVQWWRHRNAVISDRQALRILRRTNLIAGILGLLFSAWAIALFPYGGVNEQAYTGTFLTVAMLGSMLCLMHLQSSAIVVAVTVTVPSATFLVSTGIPTLIGTAVNVLLVTIAVTIVIQIQFRDFRRMVEALKRTAMLGDENLRLANIDSLTGLPNRRAFFDHLQGAFAAAQSKRSRIAVGIIDLDGFKPVNDLYGHTVGDKLLVEAGKRLASRCAAGACFMSRLGGDEFAYIVTDAPDDAALALHAEGISAVLRAPVVLPEATVQISGSVGIAVYPQMAHSPDHLFERADYAMYRGKRTKRGGASLFSAEHEAQMNFDAKIEQALKRADLEQKLSLMFQPIVDIRSGTTVGFEALARWHRPTLGRVSPA